MAGRLPRYVVLKFNYNDRSDSVRFVRCTDDGSLITDAQKDAFSPNCKFALERAQTGKDLLHIRSCYNNKYWALDDPKMPYVSARATQPNEDQSNWTCTTFKADHHFEDQSKFVLIHHYQQKSMTIIAASHGLVESSGGADKFTVIDWESLVMLPKHVAFKGDLGSYLTAQEIEGHEYHKFDSTNLGDSRVAFQIFPTGDGSVRIKSTYFNLFWRRSPNWIWADALGDRPFHRVKTFEPKRHNEEETIFVPVRVGKDSVALRSLANNNFCTRLSKEGKVNCLNADVSSITHEAILTVEEVVSSREVTNVKYRLTDARIYDENVVTMASGVAINNHSEPGNANLRLCFHKSWHNTWERLAVGGLNVSAKIKAGVPFIEDGKIVIRLPPKQCMKWGDTEETSKLVEVEWKVTVPPKTQVTCSILATRGACEVPFSYTQRDVLADGQVVTYDMDDGVYTGINTYNFRHEATTEKL